MNEQERVDSLIFRTLYRQINKAITQIAEGNIKQGTVTLKQLLPKGYEHSFHREKK